VSQQNQQLAKVVAGTLSFGSGFACWRLTITQLGCLSYGSQLIILVD
jgi:hypothetical protein